MNIKRIEQEFPIIYSLNWTYGVSISVIRKDLDALEKLGATHINIEHGINYDCSYVDIDAVCIRLETKEEAKKRIEEQNKRLKYIEDLELKKLAELKSKYEK